MSDADIDGLIRLIETTGKVVCAVVLLVGGLAIGYILASRKE